MKRIICVILAVFLLLPFGVSVYASTYPNYTLDEWRELSRQDIFDIMTNLCADNGSTYQGQVNDVNGMSGYMLYRCYKGLTGQDKRTIGNGVPLDFSSASKFMMEQYGLADFGMGVYKDNGHSGNSFGQDLNDRFDEYQQEYPYAGVNDYICYKFKNGYYITWEPLQGGQYGYGFGVGTATHLKYTYSLRFYLHNESGKIIEISTDSYDGPISCPTCNTTPYHNFTILPDGKFSYDAERTGWVHIGDLATYTHTFPWYSTYGEGEEDEPPVTPIPITLYNIDNGDTIYAYREGDQINYNNNYYDYGDTVTIGGNTYSVYYDYRDMSEDYLNEFYNYVYNYYYDNIGTDYKFDDSAILEALRAIYDKLQAIFNKLQAGFRNVTNKLNDILKQLKDVNASLDDITEKDKEDSKALWLELIKDFKTKISYDQIEEGMNNIQTAFFAKRDYSTNEKGAVTVVIEKDDVVLPSSLPQLTVEIMGRKYRLYDCVGSLGSEMDTIRGFIGFFLVVDFIVMLFRSAPSVIGGVSSCSDAFNDYYSQKNKKEDD